MNFSDSHCHLDFEPLNEQPELLNQCISKGIHRIVVPAVSPDNWQQVLTLANQRHAITLLPALGIHPWFLDNLTSHALDNLSALVAQNSDAICAIGETGIDRVISEKAVDATLHLSKQIEFFEYQLQLAKQYNKPIIVHHRKSHPEVSALLKKHLPIAGGVIHAFSGSYQQAKQYLDVGFKLGIGGTISYQRAQKTLKTVSKLPLDSLLLETDAPAMPLSGDQGLANSPLNVIKVFNYLTALRNEQPEQLAEALEANFDQLFMLNR